MKKLPTPELQRDLLHRLVETCVSAIVERPEDARVHCHVTPVRVLISVHVVSSDMGLVLGKEGATADAIRRLVWTACKKTAFQRVDVDFVVAC